MKHNIKLTQSFEPLFFRISNDDDLIHFDRLIQGHPEIVIYDEVSAQLCNLVRLRNPTSNLSVAEASDLVAKHLGNKTLDEYGAWIYYPWNNSVVRLLEEEEFEEVKTNRNKNKITKEEQDILATKKVGIVGLSVGQSVATTLVLERGAGELRIADHDTLELTNCNRIRTSLRNLGLKKTVITAREIAEIDPYMKLSCFHDGVTEENIDKFITEGGMLDLIIDECDSIDIKILLRQKAKQYGIPVVMEMSDRGMIDIERFDLNKEIPLFHGKIEDLDLSDLKNLSVTEKVRYLYQMVDGHNVSTRMKESLTELGKTISTWPQLASAVVMGGGICADVCRRVLLKQINKSGRFYVDLEQIIND